MKKIFALFVLLVFLAACGPSEPSSYEREKTDSVDVTEPAVSEPAEPEEKVAETPKEEVGRKPPKMTPPSEKIDYSLPEGEEEVVKEDKKLDPAIKDLMDRSESKISSYGYLYGGPETGGIFKDTYYFQLKDGDIVKAKIKKYEADDYVRENETTHLYMDPNAKTFVGCCEILSRCISENLDNTNKTFNYDFEERWAAMPRTPLQWMDMIPEGAKVRGTETFEENSVTTVTFETPDGHQWEYKVNSVYGLPHVIIERANEEQVAKYQFNDLIFNLRDIEWDAPCLKTE